MLNRALRDSPNVLAYQRNRLVQSRQPSEARILMLTGFSFMTSISRLDPKQTSPRIQIFQQNCFECSSQVPASVPGQARSRQPYTFNQTRREGARGGRPSHGATSCAHQQPTAVSDPPPEQHQKATAALQSDRYVTRVCLESFWLQWCWRFPHKQTWNFSSS